MTSSRFFPFTKTSQSHKYHPFRGMFTKYRTIRKALKILSLIAQVTCNSRDVKSSDLTHSQQVSKPTTEPAVWLTLLFKGHTRHRWSFGTLWTCPLIFTTLTNICVVWDNWNLGWPGYDLVKKKVNMFSAVTFIDLKGKFTKQFIIYYIYYSASDFR